MSNSPLVTYRCISPNKTSPRRNTIKKITIHHMAGNLSLQTCGQGFANPKRKASANYGVDSQGRIGQFVDEDDRAWTSSNGDNDHQAVTIEVANDQIGGDWHVSDKALAATINLCVDICRRNGISHIDFTGDASGNLTMHRYFAATACPGKYLASRFSYIASEVNGRLLGNQQTQKKEETMDGDKIVEALTNEQAYTLLKKAEKHMETMPEPKWSKKEGYWRKATDAGVLNGESPEAFMRRDEVAALLGRKGLL